MEIKTTYDIATEEDIKVNKKWVAVDDVKEKLLRLISEIDCRIEHGANKKQIIDSVDTIFKELTK